MYSRSQEPDKGLKLLSFTLAVIFVYAGLYYHFTSPEIFVLDMLLGAVLLYHSLNDLFHWSWESFEDFLFSFVIVFLTFFWWALTLAGFAYLIFYVMGDGLPLFGVISLLTLSALVVSQYFLLDIGIRVLNKVFRRPANAKS
jgi:hypothetical protein